MEGEDEEFQEEDVWAVLNGSSNSPTTINPMQQLPKTTPTTIIPRTNKKSAQNPKKISHSAPENIPDWSKIYGKNSKTPSWLDVDHDHDDHNDDDGGGGGSDDDDDDDDDDGDESDDDGKMVPPHEWVAKKLARSKTFSFSVCEGAGRTLKGRDLSRLRNTVLTKTGFLE